MASKKSLSDEASEAAVEVVGEGEDLDGQRLDYAMAYEHLIGRVRKGRKRGLGVARGRGFLRAVIAVAETRLKALQEPKVRQG